MRFQRSRRAVALMLLSCFFGLANSAWAAPSVGGQAWWSFVAAFWQIWVSGEDGERADGGVGQSPLSLGGSRPAGERIARDGQSPDKEGCLIEPDGKPRCL